MTMQCHPARQQPTVYPGAASMVFYQDYTCLDPTQLTAVFSTDGNMFGQHDVDQQL